MITLFDYYRSSASYRVRIALYLKAVEFKIQHVDLLTGEHVAPAFMAANPQGMVPLLVDGDFTLSQSMAMIEYLDETHPENPMVFGTAQDKAYIRQMAEIIACDIAPLNVPRVWKKYVGGVLGADEKQSEAWFAHWVHKGFGPYEDSLKKSGRMGKFTCGDQPSMADACLIPQVYNARRFNIDLDAYPLIRGIERNCVAHYAFQKAAPESHAHAPKGLEQIHGPNAPLLADAA